MGPLVWAILVVGGLTTPLAVNRTALAKQQPVGGLASPVAVNRTTLAKQQPMEIPPGDLVRSTGRQIQENVPKSAKGRAPSCNGCQRRESALAKTMRLSAFSQVVATIGVANTILLGTLLLLLVSAGARHFLPREMLVTLFYTLLYMLASPTAILVNKVLMKDYGFGYPVLVSALGQGTTAIAAWVAVQLGYVSLETGRQVEKKNLIILGGASALALVLGQYPYLYLTVAFIQMLKAFSPAYMVIFLYCLGVEYPSRRVISCILGLSAFTAVASAGEVNFNVIGVLFMAAASISDALRLVIAQKLLKNLKMQPMETLCTHAGAALQDHILSPQSSHHRSPLPHPSVLRAPS